MKRTFFLVWLIVFLLFVAGCTEKRVIDDINIATAVGIDKGENNQLSGSLLIHVFKADRSIENFTFTANGSMMRDVIAQMQKKASQPIFGGSLDVALIEEGIARKGVIDVIDVFLRDPTVGARLHLAIVDGKAEEVFHGQYGDRGNSEYLKELIEHNMKGENLPRSNLHRFLFDFYQKGQDPYLPVLKKMNDDLVSITGMALFKDEKIVDILPENKLFYFKLLVDRHTNGSIMVKDSHGQSKIKSISSKLKIKLTKRNPYEFTLNIRIKGFLGEHQGRGLKKNEVGTIEKELEKQVIKECTKLFEEFQKQKIDPVGFGHFAKTRTRNFNFNTWSEEYPRATFKVNAKASIVQVGVVE